MDSAEKEALRAEVAKATAERRDRRRAEIRASLIWHNKGRYRWEATTDLGTMVCDRKQPHHWICGRLGDKQSLGAKSLAEAKENIVALILLNAP